MHGHELTKARIDSEGEVRFAAARLLTLASQKQKYRPA